MKKRFLSLCMAVTMLLSCLCITPAAAADNGLRVQSVAPSEELIRQTSFLGLDSYVSLLKIYGDVSDDLAAPYDYKDGKCTVCGAADPDYRPEQPENPGQPEKPEQPENPGVKTGDSGVLLYMGLMLLALTGSAWVPWKKRAR